MNDERSHLAALIDRTLRQLPLRSAPQELQARVFSRLHKATKVWWRRSILYWPVSVRAAFILLSLALANASVVVWRAVAAGSKSNELLGILQRPTSWAEGFGNSVQVLLEFVTLLLRHTPAWWLQLSVVLVTVLYALLFGLGTAALRALTVQR